MNKFNSNEKYCYVIHKRFTYKTKKGKITKTAIANLPKIEIKIESIAPIYRETKNRPTIFMLPISLQQIL